MRARIQQGRFSTTLILAWVTALCPAVAVDYLRDIKPVFKERCQSCHGALKQQAGLRLDTAARLLAGGKDGVVVVPGKPDASRLIDRLTTSDVHERMPLEAAPLQPQQIAAIREWILAGAPVPPDEKGEEDPLEHWSFRRIERPPMPEIGEVAHPVDRFLVAKHREKKLRTAPEAERTLLLRRLYLDLMGLPPTAEQLSDERAYEDIVDELLASPHHGERWARHWMDVWRYSDWYGLGDQLRNSQKHLWHWRDWIVESLNEDKGYDRMIEEMIAADELAPGDAYAVRATGFLARNYYLFNRTTWLDDTLEHTGKAFLGLTLNCAKCHDHKYDPIEMVDYYNLRAVFEPHQVRLDPVPGVIDFEKNGIPRVFDDHPDAETFLHVRGDPANPDKTIKITPAVPAVFAAFAPPLEPVALPLGEWAPATRKTFQEDHLAAARGKVEATGKDLERAFAKAGAGGAPVAKAADPAKEVALAEAASDVAVAELAHLEAVIAADTAALAKPDEALARAASQREAEMLAARAKSDLLKLGPDGDTKKVKAAEEALAVAEKKLAAKDADYTPLRGAKKALETPEHKEDTYGPSFSPTSTGRRLMFAKWITSRENPLAARVAVNQVWMRHFGEPLVETIFDFGRQAPRPEHLELLDWLAVEFMESGWSFKHLHRLLVTSQAYRRCSSNAGMDPATLAADSINRFYWRANPRRMESQVVRDSLLHLAGELDVSMGGPSVPPNGASKRRGIYFTHSRDEEDKFLTMFDNADILQCYRRPESIVPQQALALANAAISIDASGKIAARVHAARPGADRGAFVDGVFALLLGRSPDRAEREACLDYWTDMGDLESVRDSRDPQATIRARLVHAVLNHNDFVTVR